MRIKHFFSGWGLTTLVFGVLLTFPTAMLMIRMFRPANANWAHIQQFMLTGYLMDTVTLAFWTGAFSVAIGVTLAWLVSAYQFPFRNTLKWALMLPLAIPPYIGGYTYHGMLNYTSVLQTTLRNRFDIKVNQNYFDILNMPGAVFIFTIFLYPYVYAITRAFLARQATSLIDNARVLGSGAFRTFFYVILPISRASIVGGVSLVILEVLNDYGVVKYFGIQTFSTAIFQTWFSFGDLDSAIKLAGILMTVVIFIILLEKFLRGRKQFSYSNTKVSPLRPQPVYGWKKWTIGGFTTTIFILGFVLPALQLIYWATLTFDSIYSIAFVRIIFNSALVATIGAVLVIVFALIVANFMRMRKGVLSNAIAKLTVLGYSIPGAVIAVGVISFFIATDEWLFGVYELFGLPPTLLLSTSLTMLLFAYVIRFMAIGYNSVESGFDKVGTTFTEASRVLGMSWTATFFRVDVQLIRPAIFSGFILVFIDILKELPLTLILRPFNFETLSTTAYRYANNEMVQEAALSSLFITFISAISIYMFYHLIEKEPN
nr:iron ABC transporter permease [Bacillus fonticola]